LHAADSFTQADINAGRVAYHNLSNAGSDSFSFTVADGAGGSIAQTTFNLSVNPASSAPVLPPTPMPEAPPAPEPAPPIEPLPPAVLTAFAPGGAASDSILTTALPSDSHAITSGPTFSAPAFGLTSSLLGSEQGRSPSLADHAPSLGGTASFIVRQNSPGSDTGPALLAAIPMTSVAVSGDGGLSFSLPRGTFVEAVPNAKVMVDALQANGAPLPGWLHFDPASGTFNGKPPAGWHQQLDLQVTARDSQGNRATTHIRVKFEAAHRPDIRGEAHLPAADRLASLQDRHHFALGKAALNEQFAGHGKSAWLRDQDALIAHAESLARLRSPA